MDTWNNKTINLMQIALIKALGKEPNNNITRGKAKSIIKNKFAKKRKKYEHNNQRGN